MSSLPAMGNRVTSMSARVMLRKMVLLLLLPSLLLPNRRVCRARQFPPMEKMISPDKN